MEAAPALARSAEGGEPPGSVTEPKDDDAARSPAPEAEPDTAAEDQDDDEDEDPAAAQAPLPALAAEVKAARDAQREAVAEGAAALAEAREAHLQELAAEQERLAQEEAEAEAELERQRQEQEAADEAAEEEAEAEQDSSPEPTPQQPTPDAPADSTFTGDLDAYLADLASSHSGDISISLTEIGGQGRSASTGGGESRVSASTYKLFVAYGILDRVESGEMDWDDTVDGGRDRATCLTEMISVSDNPCADVFRDELGWRGLRDIAAETGGPATDFIPAYARTSANDLTAFLTRLETGQLGLSEDSRTRLLGALGSNIFRQGIPSGSAGTVLNKVGFIEGYLNDAAIVRHPQGTYVLSIMSEGSDWEAIASITRKVEAALY